MNKKTNLENQIINFYKPTGLSSAQTLNLIKKLCGVKKAGFAGTLDPMASGILLIGFNKSTKTLHELSQTDKAYYVEILFGVQTDTGDITGQVINESTNINLNFDEIKEAVSRFVKTQYVQATPRYSAVKINGVRAYKLARKNIDFIPPQREVNVYTAGCLGWDCPVLGVVIHVSKGFYVREFVNDLAKQLNTCATAKKIVRIRCGNFNLKDAITLKQLKQTYGR